MLARPATPSDEIADALRARGAIVTSVPLIRISEPSDRAALKRAAESVDATNWLIFTSANGVAAFARSLRKALPARVRIAAVGPATAAAVQSLLQHPVDLIPERHDSDALAAALIVAARPGSTMCVLQPEDTQSSLVARLRSAGHNVSAAAAYRTLEAPPSDLARNVASTDAIVLTSGSQARALASGLGESARDVLAGKIIVVIGERTAHEAENAGLHVHATAPGATPEAVAKALASTR